MKTLIKNLLFVFASIFLLAGTAFATPINVEDIKYERVNGEYMFHVTMNNANVALGQYAELEFSIEELGTSKVIETIKIDDNESHVFTYNLREITDSYDKLENGETYRTTVKTKTNDVYSNTMTLPFLFGAEADTEDELVVQDIKVDGTSISGNVLEVANGATFDLEFTIFPKETVEDFDLSARIFGYEHETIVSDLDAPITLTAGKMKVVSLTIELPDNMDAEEDYTIRISGGNRGLYFEKTFDLFVQTQRNRVDVLDLVMTPSSGVEPGQNIIANVRMKNRGQKSQDSVKVYVEIPELGVSESSYVSELNSDEVATSDDMLLFVPESAAAGEYEMLVKLTYNDNYEETVEAFTLNVLSPKTAAEKNLLVSFKNNVDLAAGSETVFDVVVANPNSESKPISLASLENVWANVEVTPSLAMVKGGDSETFTVKVTPKSAIAGEKELTLVVKEGADSVSELTVSTYVAAGNEPVNWVNVGLAVLLIVAIIILLALVITIAKRKGGDDEDESSSTEEYY